jgi:hypothetical protein
MSGSRKWPVWLWIAAIGTALVGVLFDRGLGGREPSRRPTPYDRRPETPWQEPVRPRPTTTPNPTPYWWRTIGMI